MNKIFIKIIFIILLCFPANSEIKRISEGDINAKIKIIVYESLTCSHCADFHKNVYPKLKKEFIETGRVFIEYRNFPLNLAALNAAKIAHCKNNGKTEVLHFLFKNYDNWVNGSTMEELNNNLNILIKKQYLNILRFSGLYIDSSKHSSHNRLNRNTAAKIISFAINNLSQNKENNIYNCSEDCEILASVKSVSNKETSSQISFERNSNNSNELKL